MALISLGAALSNISGSVGGATFARNRGGSYMRNRTIPLNPQSSFQSPLRARFGDLAQRWSGSLTDSQRSGWDSYAEGTPIVNKLGDERVLSGINWYASINSVKLLMGEPISDDPPPFNGVGPSGNVGLTIDAASDTFDVVSAASTIDFGTGSKGLVVQFSRPQNVGVNFFSGPFRTAFGGMLTGPLDFPVDVPLPFSVQPGQVVFSRHRWTFSDGRVGVPEIQRFLVA